MNWKETVMSDKVLLKKMLGLPDTSTITEYAAQQDMCLPPGLYYKMGAQAQAEITWDKAVREMVEWMIKYRSESTGQFICFTLNKEQWQAKLKEWGRVE